MAATTLTLGEYLYIRIQISFMKNLNNIVGTVLFVAVACVVGIIDCSFHKVLCYCKPIVPMI